jgi:endonuclease-3
MESQKNADYRSAAARAAYIDRYLAELYPETPIPLDHTNPYTLLIAVLLSAQCTDKRVNLQTPGLFAKADNPRDMVKLSVAEIDAHVRPCALAPRKAQAIHRLSEMLLERHGGEVPRTFAQLEEDGVCRDGAGLWRAGVPGRHAHSPARAALETHPARGQRRADRA